MQPQKSQSSEQMISALPIKTPNPVVPSQNDSTKFLDSPLKLQFRWKQNFQINIRIFSYKKKW